MKPFVLGIIPARGGSKRIPDKNIVKLNGKPLISYTVEAAKGSLELDDVIVSTDSAVITEVAESLGINVPFRRPDEFSTDNAQTVDVLTHVVKEYEAAYKKTVEIIVTLQPTQPLRSASDIDSTIALLDKDTRSESVITCYEANNIQPDYLYKPVDGRVEPFMQKSAGAEAEQKRKTVYLRNGAVYVTKRRLLMEERKIMEDLPLYYVMPRERSFNIDEPFDLELCEAYLKYRNG